VVDAEFSSEPYCHFHMNDVFLPSYYQEIIDNLPPTKNYDKFIKSEDYKEEYTRLRYPVREETLDSLHPIFTELHTALTDEGLRNVIFTLLAPDIEKRFPQGIYTVDCSPHVFLFRDLQGYSIKPHADAQSKVVTMQFYLPKDNNHTKVGTVVYEKEDENFVSVKQFPFKMNSGYAFAVGDDSWHGVDHVDTGDSFERDSLMVIYYLNHKKYK
jgi:hypothetical protein